MEISKIGKHTATVIKKKKKKEKTQITITGMEKKILLHFYRNAERLVRKYVQFHTSKFSNLNEVDKCLERYQIP